MKICFVLEHFYPHIGGVETVFFEYAKRLVAKGNEVRIVTSNSGDINGTLKTNGFEISYLKCKSFFGHPILPSSKIEKSIKWSDIVHTTTYTAALPALNLSKKLKKPCIITVHEALGWKWFKIEKNPLKALGFLIFESYTIRKSFDQWHAISQATKSDLLKCNIPEEKITLIYHGIDRTIWNPSVKKIDLNSYFGIDKNHKIFLYSGRPGKTKGIFVLLDAIRNIKNNIPPEFKFGFMFSDDPLSEKEKFKKLVNRHHLTELIKVKRAAKPEELPGLRKSAHAVIIPSITEGFGFSAAETANLEVPIILSNAGSLPEVVSGKHIFFKNGDSRDLAKRILLAAESRFDSALYKKFDWIDSTNKMLELYKKILSTK